MRIDLRTKVRVFLDDEAIDYLNHGNVFTHTDKNLGLTIQLCKCECQRNKTKKQNDKKDEDVENNLNVWM